MDGLPSRNEAATIVDPPDFRLGLRLAEVSRLWRATLDSRLRPHGLSTARWVILVNLSVHPEGLTQNALAVRVGIRGSTLVRQLDLLEADGWVERRDSPHDRRVKKVFLTDRARPVLEHILTVGRELRSELVEGIDEAELRICVAVLDRLKARLQTLADDEATADEAA